VDKLQKELILTYFRKRRQTAKNDYYSYKDKLTPYEIWYGMEHNFIFQDDLNLSDIYYLLKHKPDMLNKIDITKMSPFDLANIITGNSKLLDKINLDEIKPGYRSLFIAISISLMPELINVFKDRLIELNSEYLRGILMNRPDFSDYMSDDVISNIDHEDATILIKHLNPFRIDSPELVNRLKNHIDNDLYSKVNRANPSMGEYLLRNYPEKLK
jgi:hypothetical protein